MSAAVITLSAIAGGSSLIAAYYWSRSTKIKLTPVFPDWSLPGTGGRIEPVDPHMKSMDMQIASMQSHQATSDTFAVSGRLNQIAAWWSYASAAASTAAVLIGLLTP